MRTTTPVPCFLRPRWRVRCVTRALPRSCRDLKKQTLAEDKSAEQQDAEEVVTGMHHQSVVTSSLSLFMVLLPLVLPLVVYLGVSNPMLEARHGRFVRGDFRLGR
ncbi:hypothetical protein MRX96_040666 [Rhipicephalus microplus]